MRYKYKTIWINKFGDKIKVKDMDDQYLTNVFKHIEREVREEAINELAKKYRPAIWYTIYNELLKRKGANSNDKE